MPRTRPIELPVALLLATAAFAFSVAGACAVLLAGLVVVAGHAEVVLRAGWPTWCAAAALGCANAAGLLALTRRSGGLHPLALAAAWLLGFAVPLPGAPVPAALAAAAGTGLAVRLGARRGPAANALPAAAALALAALALLVVAFDGADGAVPAPPRRARGARARTARGAPAGAGARARTRRRRGPPRPCARTTARSTTAPSGGPGARSRRPSGAASAASTAGARASPPRSSSRPAGLRTVRAGDARIVAGRLEARDRAACGVLVRRFDVRWRLERGAAGWRAASLTGSPVAGTACG